MTARSQIIGAVAMGIGHALLECSEVDDRTGRFINTDLAGRRFCSAASTTPMQALAVQRASARSASPQQSRTPCMRRPETRVRTLPIRIESVL